MKKQKATKATKATKKANPTALAQPEAPQRAQQDSRYGKTENRQMCHVCGSRESRVYTTRQAGRLTIRYRTCLVCGAKRTTTEIRS